MELSAEFLIYTTIYRNFLQILVSILILKMDQKSVLRNHKNLPGYLKNKPKFAFAANLYEYLNRDQEKIKEKFITSLIIFLL